jgi:glycosyltransferase involved in cell wall biosynthesis
VKKGNYFLWLPSWYPNEREPFNGDFIQRHAKAASFNNNIIIIFFTQFGETVKQEAKVVNDTRGNLKEIVVYVPFKPIGFRLIDRVRYNLVFYKFSAEFLKCYFEKEGLPLLVHVHVPMKAGNLALWIKHKFHVPYIVSEHSSTYSEQAGAGYFKRRHLLYQFNVKRIFSKAILVTNVSQAIGSVIQNLFSITELHVIPNVVDTTLFYPTRYEKGVFTYVHVSSLSEQKNIFGMLRAFKRMVSIRNDWKLSVVGPFTQEIHLFIKKEGLENFVSLIGEVSYETVATYMNQAQVLVLFSKHENFPCVVIEALCCGIPVTASDVAGIKEAVNLSNGILVESENESQLLQALLKIREDYDNYDREHIAAKASGQFSYPVIASKFDQLYKEVLEKIHSK